MAGRFYLDSSAYVPVLTGKDEGAPISRVIGEGKVLSSVLMVLETTRTLVRMSRDGKLSPEMLYPTLERMEEQLEEMSLKELTLDICLGMVMPLLSTPRSLDLVHLRTALWFHREESLTAFISLDRRQNRAARELELPLWKRKA